MIKTIQNSRLLKTMTATFMMILLITSLMTFIPTKRAEAAPVLVPLVGEGLIGILETLGIVVAASGAAAVGGYELTQAYPYIRDFFYNAGTTVADWCAALPPDTYYTDSMGNFYLGDGTMVTGIQDLLLSAEYLPDTYSIPVNFVSHLTSNVYVQGEGNCTAVDFTHIVRNNNLWYTPCFYDFSYGRYAISDIAVHVGLEATSWKFVNFYVNGDPVVETIGNQAITLFDRRRSYMNFPTNVTEAISSKWIASQGVITSFNGADNGYYSNVQWPTSYRYVDGTKASDNYRDLYSSQFGSFGLLASQEIPRYEIDVDSTELEDVYISPAPDYQPPDNGDDDDGGIALLPPDLWEIFKTVKDFLTKDNNNTTLKDYVNNNYNYNTVDVDVNIPESFHIFFESPLDVNLNLSGGINVDITINENLSLPSVDEGDGENFFSANVIDVFAGLTTNNPVFAVIKELFSVIDPALVAIFSVTISLMLVLALWKLIRG